MASLIAWLNANSGVLTLVFSAVVAAATVFYVKLTSRLVEESRLLRESQAQPHVAVRVQLNQAAFGFVDLVVENAGLGPAYDVSFAFTPDFELETNPKRRLGDIGFLRNGLRYLAHRDAVSTHLMGLIGVDQAKLEGPNRLQFTIGVSYKDALGKARSESYQIDFAHFVGLIRLGAPPLPEMVRHLEKIEGHLGKLETGWSKLKVILYSPSDIKREGDAFRLAQISGQLIDEATANPESTGGKDDAA